MYASQSENLANWLNKKIINWPVVWRNHLRLILTGLYISPLSACNLRCKICYTEKSNQRMTNQTIINFVNRYDQDVIQTTNLTFCGGEVFLLSDFSSLVNDCNRLGKIISIITNGTIDRLDEFIDPNQVNLIVSLDGLEDIHNFNRGESRFEQSLLFARKALSLNFHLEVFSIVHQANLSQVSQFEDFIHQQLGEDIQITFHPRKPPAYLLMHPRDNLGKEQMQLAFLTINQMRELGDSRLLFPPEEFGCYQLALFADQKVYGCCEGTKALGDINDQPRLLVEKLIDQVNQSLREYQSLDSHISASRYLGCSQCEFHCGLKQLRKLTKN